MINKLLYLSIFIATTIYAWVSGERVLYIGAVVLFLLPIASYAVIFFMLRGLKLKQSVPKTIVKNERGVFKVRLHNVSPIPFMRVECIFYGDEHAVTIEKSEEIKLNPYKPVIIEIPFTVAYRGQYQLGLHAVTASDITGLFRLKRRYHRNAEIISLPRVVDFSKFSPAMNLLSHSHSRFDIRDEDYATISDIRPYVPTDSIKRVHWKLTAKRNEWLVKIFQANALNQVKLIADSTAVNAPIQEQYYIEDSIVETVISFANFCLSRGMPVDFITTEGFEVNAKSVQHFDEIYNVAAQMVFSPKPELNPMSVLTHALNEATGYVNAVICTAILDRELCERILNAVANGHYIAVLYFPTEETDEESEEIFRILNDGNIVCVKVGETK